MSPPVSILLHPPRRRRSSSSIVLRWLFLQGWPRYLLVPLDWRFSRSAGLAKWLWRSFTRLRRDPDLLVLWLARRAFNAVTCSGKRGKRSAEADEEGSDDGPERRQPAAPLATPPAAFRSRRAADSSGGSGGTGDASSRRSGGAAAATGSPMPPRGGGSEGMRMRSFRAAGVGTVSMRGSPRRVVARGASMYHQGLADPSSSERPGRSRGRGRTSSLPDLAISAPSASGHGNAEGSQSRHVVFSLASKPRGEESLRRGQVGQRSFSAGGGPAEAAAFPLPRVKGAGGARGGPSEGRRLGSEAPLSPSKKGDSAGSAAPDGLSGSGVLGPLPQSRTLSQMLSRTLSRTKSTGNVTLFPESGGMSMRRGGAVVVTATAAVTDESMLGRRADSSVLPPQAEGSVRGVARSGYGSRRGGIAGGALGGSSFRRAAFLPRESPRAVNSCAGAASPPSTRPPLPGPAAPAPYPVSGEAEGTFAGAASGLSQVPPGAQIQARFDSPQRGRHGSALASFPSLNLRRISEVKNVRGKVGGDTTQGPPARVLPGIAAADAAEATRAGGGDGRVMTARPAPLRLQQKQEAGNREASPQREGSARGWLQSPAGGAAPAATPWRRESMSPSASSIGSKERPLLYSRDAASPERAEAGPSSKGSPLGSRVEARSKSVGGARLFGMPYRSSDELGGGLLMSRTGEDSADAAQRSLPVLSRALSIGLSPSIRPPENASGSGSVAGRRLPARALSTSTLAWRLSVGASGAGAIGTAPSASSLAPSPPLRLSQGARSMRGSYTGADANGNVAVLGRAAAAAAATRQRGQRSPSRREEVSSNASQAELRVGGGTTGETLVLLPLSPGPASPRRRRGAGTRARRAAQNVHGETHERIAEVYGRNVQEAERQKTLRVVRLERSVPCARACGCGRAGSEVVQARDS